MKKQKVFAIVGPTGSGKTTLSLALCKMFSGEVISGDSMQIYQKMNIGTAKPDKREKDGISHHVMDILSPEEDFSVVRYCDLATNALQEILFRGNHPFVVGGTGLYIDSFLTGNRFSIMESDPKLRLELNQIADRDGGQALHQMLASFDPQSAAQIHPNNRIRLIRAIEVYKMTGKPISYFNSISKDKETPYEVCWLGLCVLNRQFLYDRINQRVDKMMDDGLLDEVRNLYGKYKLSTTAANAIGYKEMIDFLDGKTSRQEAVEAVKQGSRRYAKRQITWFKRNKQIHWFEIDQQDSQKIVDESAYIIENFLNQ